SRPEGGQDACRLGKALPRKHLIHGRPAHTQYFRRARLVAIDNAQNVHQMSSLNLLHRWKIFFRRSVQPPFGNGWRKIMDVDGVTCRVQASVADYILQLSDASRPRVRRQAYLRPTSYAVYVLTV